MMKQTTNTKVAQEALWEKISAFPLDEQGASFPFSRKLAREQGWSRAFTLGAIAEYRKFIFLCCISPHGASPSKVIDEVWHLHLLYTQNYWEQFCSGILGRNLHHHPSPGGNAEDRKHREWRSDTLDRYRETFHEEPPACYWSDDGEKDAAKYKGLIRQLSSWLLLIPVLLLGGCSSGPLGILFLILFPFFFFTSIANLRPANSSHKRNEPNSKDGASSCSGGGSSCGSGGSSCGGGGCGGGCGGCGGGGCGS